MSTDTGKPGTLPIPEVTVTAAADAIRSYDILHGETPAILARAAVEAAAPLLAEAWGAFECEPARPGVTEWGVLRWAEGREHSYGTDAEAERLARAVASDHRKSGTPGVLVRRTVTYGRWEPADAADPPARHPMTGED